MVHLAAWTWDMFWWPATGRGYAFWSSFGSCLTEFAVIGVLYKRFKCKKCWRLAHHRVEGTHYKTCHVHTTERDHSGLKLRHESRHPETHSFLNGGR